MDISILLTGIGGVTPQSIARSLRLGNNTYKIIGTDINKYANGLYLDDKLIDNSYMVPPANADNYFDEINKIVDKEKIDIVIVSPDSELDLMIENADKIRTRTFMPPAKLTKVILNKMITAEKLKETEFAPKSMMLENKEDLLDARDNFSLPLWIREIKGTSGVGAFKVNNIEEANFWITQKDGWGNFMAAEYLPGRNLGLKCLYYKGELIASACQERIEYVMSQVSPTGITGNASIGRFIEDSNINNFGENLINYLANRLDIEPHGVLTIDIKEDRDGKPKVTEINPRHIATTYCFARAGANFSEWMVDLVFDNLSYEVPKYNAADSGFYFLRGVDAEPVVIKKDALFAT